MLFNMAKQNQFWADQVAQGLIKKHGKSKYVVAAGITPSGTIHMGNFREVATQYLIAKALEHAGKKVRFIYSWDDYDVFRKVPNNFPNKDLLKKHLRMPITLVPDTKGCHKNFAEHNKALFVKDMEKLKINPEYLNQYEIYKDCTYANGIKKALENTDKIKEILDKGRREPLPDKWMPVMVFCDKCHKDTLKVLEWKGNYSIYYECECSFKEEFDFRKKGIIKLLWRIDWPMRWKHENVDFESAGKDHFAAGGSWDMGKQISKEVYDYEAPVGFMYEWIAIKGGGQFSSSEGNVLTLGDVLEVYESSIIMFMFAGTRPRATFSLSFDTDVLKMYEDFDNVERIYFDKNLAKDEKEYIQKKRIYELSVVGDIAKKQPLQPSFRHLTVLLQIHGNNIEELKKHFEISDSADLDRLTQRAKNALVWINKYAPEDFKFEVQKTVSKEITLDAKQKKALKLVGVKLKEQDWNEQSLFEEFYNITKEIDIETKDFFKGAYLVLLNKEKGPKLAPFILVLGKEKVAKLFESV